MGDEPAAIAFASAREWEEWLEANHAVAAGVWVKIAKKGTGIESVRYPEAVFTPGHISGELAARGESQLDLHGNFQIHGAAHELTLHVRAEVNNGDVAASTGFVIPYVQWGMKNPSNFLLKVSGKVDLTVQAVGRLQ